MGLDNLLATMERRAADTPDTSCNHGEVSAKAAPIKACTPDTPDTHEKTITANEVDKRSMRVLTMLDRCTAQRAIFNTMVGDDVILTVAIRGLGTCELAIPKAKFDPWALLELIERQGVQNAH